MEVDYQYNFMFNPNAVIRSLLVADDYDWRVRRTLKEAFAKWMREKFELEVMDAISSNPDSAGLFVFRNSRKHGKRFHQMIFCGIQSTLQCLARDQIDALLPQSALDFIESECYLEDAKFEAYSNFIESLVKSELVRIRQTQGEYTRLYYSDRIEFDRRHSEMKAVRSKDSGRSAGVPLELPASSGGTDVGEVNSDSLQ